MNFKSRLLGSAFTLVPLLLGTSRFHPQDFNIPSGDLKAVLDNYKSSVWCLSLCAQRSRLWESIRVVSEGIYRLTKH